MVITISCPSCQTSFPVDPDKIPEGGVRVRCSACAHVFRVDKPEPEPVAMVTLVPEPEPTDEPEPTVEPEPPIEPEADDETDAVPELETTPAAPGADAGGEQGAPPQAWEEGGFEEAGSGAGGAADGLEGVPHPTEQAGASSSHADWLERDPFEEEPDAAGEDAGTEDSGLAGEAEEHAPPRRDMFDQAPAAIDADPTEAASTEQGGDVFADPSHEGVTEPATESWGEPFVGAETAPHEPSAEAAGEVPGDAFEEQAAGASDDGFIELPDDLGEPAVASSSEAFHEAGADASTSETGTEPGVEASNGAGTEPAADEWTDVPEAAEAVSPAGHMAAEQPAEVPVQGFTFGKRDPTDKARRLARVLVSDMIMYNAERHQVALAQGTLAVDFQEEIDKSWKEYVDQVGPGMAEGEGRAFWVHALNDILAKGENVF